MEYSFNAVAFYLSIAGEFWLDNMYLQRRADLGNRYAG